MNELHEELHGFIGDVIGEADEDVQSILNDVRLMLPPLEQFVRSMDKIMDSANGIKVAAEKSNYSTMAMANAIRAHERQMGMVYGKFTKARDDFQKVAKVANVPLKGPKGSARPKKADPKNMSADELEADIARLYNGLQGALNRAANDGALFLKEMRKLAAKKAPSFDTVRGEVASLVQNFLKWRGGVYMLFGMLEGIIKRMNLRAKATGDIQMSRYKGPPKRRASSKKKPAKKKEDVDEPQSTEAMFEAQQGRPPADPMELLEFAQSRDHRRGMGFFERR